MTRTPWVPEPDDGASTRPLRRGSGRPLSNAHAEPWSTPADEHDTNTVRRRAEERTKAMNYMIGLMNKQEAPKPKSPEEEIRELQLAYEADVRRISALSVPDEDLEQLLGFRRDKLMTDIMALME